MAFSLKDQIYNSAYVHQLAHTLEEANADFSAPAFLEKVLDPKWENRALKERMRHLTRSLHLFLPADYPKAIGILQEVIPALSEHTLANIIFPDYVEQYGMGNLETSLNALAFFTSYGSSEFGIRPFIIAYEQATMQRMYAWAEDENYQVRRLASEGCRPRLPWAIGLPKFKKNPSPILPILDRLKADSEDYVYRSVANNLNDISKDHPKLVLDLAESWLGQHPNTDWLVKHALRTLLKQGNSRAMQCFGFDDPRQVTVNHLSLQLPVEMGKFLNFSFVIELPRTLKIRLEYGVDYLKKQGSYSRSVFKISEGVRKAGTHLIQKKHWFKDLSTRKHYPGEHFLSIIVNGVEQERAPFLLVDL